MLTLPENLVEVARKRVNTRTNNDQTTSTFRSVYLRDPGTFGPGMEVSLDEDLFDKLEEGATAVVTLYLEPRGLKAISARTNNPYDATVPRLRLVAIGEQRASKAA